MVKYHLIVMTFFLLSWFAQYAAFAKYFPYVPEKIRGLLQAIFFTLFAINSGFYISLVPLGMVFIFCWLYLMDVQVDLRRLYQIVVTSIIPLLLLMLGLLLYTLLFMPVESGVAQRLTDVFNTILNNPQQTASDPVIKAQMEELVGARQQDYAFLKPYWFVAAGLSCLICGHLLHRRLKLATWRAILIPFSFAVAILVTRTLTNTGSSQLMDRLKGVVQP